MNPDRWAVLMEAWKFGANRETFESLVKVYSERGRHYHTSAHIAACLRRMDQCLQTLDFPREVEMALWFHDAIYKPLSSKNEQKSADWAKSFLEDNGAQEDAVARVCRLIKVTEHNALTNTRDESVLVDIDLSILGEPAEEYKIFEQGVRKEYRLVPSLIYRRKRAEILRGFLERSRIFTSGCFPETMEIQAKQNLADAISKLEGRT